MEGGEIMTECAKEPTGRVLPSEEQTGIRGREVDNRVAGGGNAVGSVLDRG